MTDRRLSEVIRNRGIQGVVIAPLPRTEPLFRGFCWDYFSVVALGYSLDQPALARATNHQFQSVQLLVQRLAQAGYRRIGFAMEADQNNRVRHTWRGGFLSDASVFPSWPDVPFLLHEDWTRDRFADWLRRERPDVVVTAGPEVERWLAELGLRTPEDIGLANVDLTPAMAGCTGINQNSPLVGAAAIDLLISLMNSNQRGIPRVPQILMVQGDFVQGRTTYPARRKAPRKLPRRRDARSSRSAIRGLNVSLSRQLVGADGGGAEIVLSVACRPLSVRFSSSSRTRLPEASPPPRLARRPRRGRGARSSSLPVSLRKTGPSAASRSIVPETRRSAPGRIGFSFSAGTSAGSSR